LLNLVQLHIIAGEARDMAFMKDPVFKAAFDDARRQMREMDYRCVREDDPIRQALLEIYYATVLNTEHNDFDNH
jgi:hypothetical protein